MPAGIADVVALPFGFDGFFWRLMGAGIEIQGGTPEQFGEVIKAEIDKWGRIVKEAGIQPE